MAKPKPPRLERPDDEVTARYRRAAIRKAMAEGAELGLCNQIGLAPETAIPELDGWALSKAELDCLNAVIDGQNTVVKRTGGVTQRYQIEVAALFLSQAMTYVYHREQALSAGHPEAHAAVTLELAMERAREIWRKDLM
jgi:hypothetical protein